MAPNDEASSNPVSEIAARTFARSDLFKKEGLEDLEPFVVSQQSSTPTFIPFGIDGTSVIISPYGRVLRMSRGPSTVDPEIICLNAYDRDWNPWFATGISLLHFYATNDYFAQDPRGVGLGVIPDTKEPLSDPHLEWVNGRWPYISYTSGNLHVSILFTIQNNILSQRTSIANLSLKLKEIDYALNIGDATIYNLNPEGGRWKWEIGFPLRQIMFPEKSSGSHSTENMEPAAKDGIEARKAKRGYITISVFHNDQKVPFESISEDLTYAQSPNPLRLAPMEVQRLVVQYSDLGPYQSDKSRKPKPLDMIEFLKDDQAGKWCFSQDDEFNPMFRRHLEHILCLCLVNIDADSDDGPHTPFLTDITLESGSTPADDFYIFRYLLSMYAVLTKGDRNSKNPIPMTSTPNSSISLLEERIRQACRGHLRWCFSKDVFLASHSWPLVAEPEFNVDPARSLLCERAFVGSLQILKLSEFASMFGEGEKDLVATCIKTGALSWLDALKSGRDATSKLWYKNKKTYIAWEGRHNEGSDMLDLPEYRLGDLIYIWRAVQSLENLVKKSLLDREGDIIKEIQESLKENSLRSRDVQTLILKRFLCPMPGAGSSTSDDHSDAGYHEEMLTKSGRGADSFAVAVRRSRKRDRFILFAKDIMLYDGIEWGFFQFDNRIEVLNERHELVKVDVPNSWKKTLEAQGANDELLWENPLRYALAIAMAKHDCSLDSSASKPSELADYYWKRLQGCVLSHGQFANRIGLDADRLVSVRYPISSRITWGIPPLLLKLRFKNFDLFPKDVSAESSIPPPLDNSSSRDFRVMMAKKKRARAKIETNMSKTINTGQVSDPPERKTKDWMYSSPEFINVQAPLGMDIAIKTWEDGLCDYLVKDLHKTLDQDRLKSILERGIKAWDKEWGGFLAFRRCAMVIDVDQLHGGRPQSDLPNTFDPQEWLSANGLELRLSDARQGATAIRLIRKRFHYLATLQNEHALILYLTSPRSDRHNLAQLFLRHISFTSHLHEDVHPLADIWATELHLSFLQLVPVGSDDVEVGRSYNDSEEAESSDVCRALQWEFPLLIKESKSMISMAALSYRIVGDMGDKFWNGYFLTYLPDIPELLPNPDPEAGTKDVNDWFRKQHKNHQRKILESFIVEKMAAEIYRSTDAILRPMSNWLLPELGVAKADDRRVDEQRTRSTKCLELDIILNRLYRLTKANADALDLWVGREADRYHKPRWSEKDELKYREDVDHQKRRALQQISDLKDQCQQIQTSINQISSHRTELINNIQLAESQVTAFNSENIRIFTYATVIFYPLSFVAGLFSMQGAPKYTTTVAFLEATAIALVVTLVIVFNAETLVWPIRRLKVSIRQSARTKMEETGNAFPLSWKHVMEHIKKVEEKEIVHDNVKLEWHRSHLIYVVFLVVYLVVEFPAMRIGLAYEFITRRDKTSPRRVVVASVRILVALLVLPIYLSVSVTVLVWNILHWMLLFPYHLWTEFQKEKGKKTKEERRGQIQRDIEEKQQESKRLGTTQGARSTQKGTKKMSQNEEIEIEEKRRDDECAEKKKEQEERRQKYVSRLLNPPTYLLSTKETAQGEGKEASHLAKRIAHRLVNEREKKIAEMVKSNESMA